MEFEIEKNVPIPTTGQARKYPWKQLAVGDSFFVPETMPADLSGSRGYWQKKLDRKFILRKVSSNGTQGTRAWRVE